MSCRVIAAAAVYMCNVDQILIIISIIVIVRTGTIHLRPQSHLQVAVAAAGAAAPLVQVTAGRTVEEVTVVVAAAVLVQDVPHLGLEEGHVHVDGHHLQESTTLSSASTFSLQLTVRQTSGTAHGRWVEYFGLREIHQERYFKVPVVKNETSECLLNYEFRKLENR